MLVTVIMMNDWSKSLYLIFSNHPTNSYHVCCLDMYDREDQFVVSEILNIWQNRHFKLMNDLAISCKRVGGLLDSTKQVAAEAQIN